jgi:hypothetical protein
MKHLASILIAAALFVSPALGQSPPNTASVMVPNGGGSSVLPTPITNSLGADVNLSSITTYFDGPSVAQGTVGTWFASGTVTFTDTVAAAALVDCKLWDGTTVIASGENRITAATAGTSMSLSGFLATPAANIRISCKDLSATTGKIQFNATGNSKDSTITVYRIQ